MGFAFDFPAGHHFVKESGGFVTGAVGVRDNAGEWWGGEFAEEFIVIDADDRNFIWNSDAEAAAGIEDLLSAEVVAGHDPDRFGEFTDPMCEVVDFFVIPANAFARTIVDGAGMAGGAKGIDKVFLAPFGPVEAIVASVTEVAETALQEMFGGKVCDGAVIGLEPRERWNKAGGADIDDGDFEGPKGFGDGGIFNAGDDAGAVPGGKPGGSFVAAIVLGEVNGPGAPFANESNNAAEETAAVGVRGLNEQSDFGGGIQQSERVIRMAMIGIEKNHRERLQMHIGEECKN